MKPVSSSGRLIIILLFFMALYFGQVTVYAFRVCVHRRDNISFNIIDMHQIRCNSRLGMFVENAHSKHNKPQINCNFAEVYWITK